MPVYRLEIERGGTLWVMAHDDQGALEMALAHIIDETTLEEDASVQLRRDEDDTVVMQAAAKVWPSFAKSYAAPNPNNGSLTFSSADHR